MERTSGSSLHVLGDVGQAADHVVYGDEVQGGAGGCRQRADTALRHQADQAIDAAEHADGAGFGVAHDDGGTGDCNRPARRTR